MTHPKEEMVSLLVERLGIGRPVHPGEDLPEPEDDAEEERA